MSHRIRNRQSISTSRTESTATQSRKRLTISRIEKHLGAIVNFRHSILTPMCNAPER